MRLEDWLRTAMMVVAAVGFMVTFIIGPDVEYLVAGYRLAMTMVIALVIWNWMESLELEVVK